MRYRRLFEVDAVRLTSYSKPGVAEWLVAHDAKWFENDEGFVVQTRLGPSQITMGDWIVYDGSYFYRYENALFQRRFESIEE